MLWHDIAFLSIMVFDEFGSRLYDLIEKKLVRSHDVVFIEDQTIDDIEKAENKVSSGSEDLIDPDPIPMVKLPNPVNNSIQCDD